MLNLFYMIILMTVKIRYHLPERITYYISKMEVPVTLQSVRDDPSSDSDDPDFGNEAQNAAREEAEEIKQRDETARKKREAKELGIKYVAPKKKAVKKPVAPKRRKTSDTGSGRGRSTSRRDDSSGEEASVPTFDPTAKAQALFKARGIAIAQHAPSKPPKRSRVRHEDSSEEEIDRSQHEYESSASSQRDPDADDDDEVSRHLKRNWVNKQHPERMTKARARMEEKYNPLVKLLS